MNVLFLTIAYPEFGSNNLYSDLMEEFAARGHQVYVACSRERRSGKKTELEIQREINVLRIRTLNVTKSNLLEKGIATLLLEDQFVRAIKKYFCQITFDLVLYTTPPVTFSKAIKFVKTRDGAFTYLLLKDIFPQNAVDMGMMRHGSLIWRYFRAVEMRLYSLADYIGCLSPANVAYVLKHNPEVSAKRVEVCPNSIRPQSINLDELTRLAIRKQYSIPLDATVFIYGGNLGRPQGIPFVLEVLDYFRNNTDAYFLLVGSGTEFDHINRHLERGGHTNARLIQSMPKQEYDRLLRCCDVGLVFLDKRFTIPNFPLRLTSYMEACLPVLAATDVNTDLRDVLTQVGCGYWVESGCIEEFANMVSLLVSNPSQRTAMGQRGRAYLEERFTVSNSYEIIMSHLKG